MTSPPAYVPTQWQDVPDPTDPPDGAPPLDAANLNRIEQQLAALSVSPGVGGASAYVHTQTTPSASWVIPNPFGRRCGVDVYLGDELVEADVTATATTVSVTFPGPVVGTAVLN